MTALWILLGVCAAIWIVNCVAAWRMLRIPARRKAGHQPVPNGYPAIAERLVRERDWQAFVQAHPLGDEEAAQ